MNKIIFIPFTAIIIATALMFFSCSSFGANSGTNSIDEENEIQQSISSSSNETVEQSSSSGGASVSMREDGWCKIGNTTVSQIVGPYYSYTNDVNPTDGEILTDNCENIGTDGKQYLTLSNGEIVVNPDTEQKLCDGKGVYIEDTRNGLKFWRIRADEKLCEQWKNEGRIQE